MKKDQNDDEIWESQSHTQSVTVSSLEGRLRTKNREFHALDVSNSRPEHI